MPSTARPAVTFFCYILYVYKPFFFTAAASELKQHKGRDDIGGNVSPGNRLLPSDPEPEKEVMEEKGQKCANMYHNAHVHQHITKIITEYIRQLSLYTVCLSVVLYV